MLQKTIEERNKRPRKEVKAVKSQDDKISELEAKLSEKELQISELGTALEDEKIKSHDLEQKLANLPSTETCEEPKKKGNKKQTNKEVSDES